MVKETGGGRKCKRCNKDTNRNANSAPKKGKRHWYAWYFHCAPYGWLYMPGAAARTPDSANKGGTHKCHQCHAEFASDKDLRTHTCPKADRKHARELERARVISDSTDNGLANEMHASLPSPPPLTSRRVHLICHPRLGDATVGSNRRTRIPRASRVALESRPTSTARGRLARLPVPISSTFLCRWCLRLHLAGAQRASGAPGDVVATLTASGG